MSFHLSETFIQWWFVGFWHLKDGDLLSFGQKKNVINDIIGMALMNRRIRLVRPYERPGFGQLEEDMGRMFLSDIHNFPFDDGSILNLC